MWWLMLVSFIIFFSLNCLLDSYSLKKIVSRILFKIELIIYKDLVKRKDYNKMKSERDNDEIQQTQETLKAKQLFKSYFGNPVVKHISIEVKQQECLGILGVNGAGKTTTFKLLTRDECIDGGTVDLMINNKKVDIGKAEVRRSKTQCLNRILRINIFILFHANKFTKLRIVFLMCYLIFILFAIINKVHLNHFLYLC